MGDGSDIIEGVGAGPEPVRARRTNLFISAVLHVGATTIPVTIRNLSAHGALVEGTTLPPVGTEVRLVRGSLGSVGAAMWVSERRCGLSLEGPIAAEQWLAKPGNLGQAEIDAAVQRIKAGQVPVPTTLAIALLGDSDLPASVRTLEAQLAAVSDALASSPETIARHGAELQSLDLLAQRLARLRRQVGG
ncbi:MAG: hypothetical protein ABIO85_08865 [Sphingomicrobium sp.]